MREYSALTGISGNFAVCFC